MNSVCVKCRREGEKLFLKGERCISPHCSVLRRSYAPGQHGQSFHKKMSEFGKQLREKQKAKRLYGIAETQFANYVKKASKMTGNTSENLIRLLETRLDNVVFRLGLTVSRASARQLVSHGKIVVNGKKVSIPSYNLQVGDTITPKNKDKFEDLKAEKLVSWIEFDLKSVAGKVKHCPGREEVDIPVNESLIVEYYTR